MFVQANEVGTRLEEELVSREYCCEEGYNFPWPD